MYEVHGTVSWPILFLCLAHLFYANACMKGEVSRAAHAAAAAGARGRWPCAAHVRQRALTSRLAPPARP